MLKLKITENNEEYEFEDNEYPDVVTFMNKSEHTEFEFIRDDKPFLNIKKVDGMLFFNKL